MKMKKERFSVRRLLISGHLRPGGCNESFEML